MNFIFKTSHVDINFNKLYRSEYYYNAKISMPLSVYTTK